MSSVTSINDWQFPFCPEPPGWQLDWRAIESEFDWVRALDQCPQDPVWHAEGDVLTHTRMVCEALVQSAAWRALAPIERNVVFAATIMHDIAKPVVTRDIQGRVQAPRHAARGAQMARGLLMQSLLPAETVEHFDTREQIVALVRHHGLPLYVLDGRDPTRELFAASQVARCDWLAMIARADVCGRVCANPQQLHDRVELFEEFSRENHCYNAPRQFASEHTRFVYFRGRDVDPDIEAFDDTRFEVVLMCGLPGSGKDHWLGQVKAARPVVSLDAVRKQLKIAPDEEQGPVISQAKELARSYLRAGRSFVWNATNTTLMMRRQLIQFVSDYAASVKIVYVETAWPQLLRRNRQRPSQVPERVLSRLAQKLDVPNTTEAHHVSTHIF